MAIPSQALQLQGRCRDFMVATQTNQVVGKEKVQTTNTFSGSESYSGKLIQRSQVQSL